MMNNPLMQLVQAAKSGGNPVAMLNRMAGQNPQLAQAMKMLNGKNSAQLQQMAQNMAKERGINLEDYIKQLGLM